MGMMGMFKWLRKDLNNQQRQRSHGWHFSSYRVKTLNNNDAYRNALQAFIDRRRLSHDPSTSSTLNVSMSPNKPNTKNDGIKSMIPGVPRVNPTDIFEIGSIAGTENRYLELIFAEWQDTRVSLKRAINLEFQDAIESDLKTLLEIRHPNILLLMATTVTENHHLVSIFESIDCTLYNYIHKQGKTISIQGIAKNGGRLADALRHCHTRGYIHSALSSHCVYLVSNGTVKLGGWELATDLNNPNKNNNCHYEDYLRTEIFRWQAPEILNGGKASKESDVYGLALIIWEMCTMNFPWDGYDKPDIVKHCLQANRGVVVDLNHFPSILKNLIEAGLQLEPSKRTMDVNRMRRFLQRLEMQYENEESIYVHTNNESSFNRTESLIKSPASTMKLIRPTMQEKQIQRRKSTDRMSIISRLINNSKKIDSLEIIDNVTSISSPPIDTTTEDGISTTLNPRTTLKNLKQTLAQQRAEFFYGSESSRNISSCENNSSNSQLISKDYEPHKPASHKTSFQPKPNKSFQIIPHCLEKDFQRSMYKIPEINPSNAWKKEQLICISRMSKDGEPTFIFTTNNSPKSDATYVIKNETATKPLTSPTRTYNIYTDDDNKFTFNEDEFRQNKKNKPNLGTSKNDLYRRRSLPAALSNKKTKDKDLPDNTIEDLYIDDEFGDGLNVNMILLNDNSEEL